MKKVLRVLESVQKSPQQKTHAMQKPVNQRAVQINWLIAAKREPKIRGDIEQIKVSIILAVS